MLSSVSMVRREDALLEPAYATRPWVVILMTVRRYCAQRDAGRPRRALQSKWQNQLVKFMDIARSFEIRIKMINEMKELDEAGVRL